MLKADRLKRKKRIRAKISGTIERPRLSVFRSNKFTYAQLIDDDSAITIAEAHGEDAAKVGAAIAKNGIAKNIKSVIFDRNGYVYHGRIKVLADAARAEGLVF